MLTTFAYPASGVTIAPGEPGSPTVAGWTWWQNGEVDHGRQVLTDADGRLVAILLDQAYPGAPDYRCVP